jgi:hypothetical protein
LQVKGKEGVRGETVVVAVGVKNTEEGHGDEKAPLSYIGDRID